MKQTVLLVDDCSLLRASVNEYLSSFGVHSIPTGTLADARRILEGEIVDVVVTDIILGKETAVPLIQKAASLNLRVVITTALVEEGVRRLLGTLAQRVSILEKPFDLSRLRRCVTLSASGSIPRCASAAPMAPAGFVL